MKKLSLLLASIGAGLLLVGGTVAAYIVNAADPVNVRVSPGTITTDEYGRVVLGWGSNSMHTVQNLNPDEETSVGSVVLAANFTKALNDDTVYSGAFGVSVSNTSVATHDLRDYLEFKLYKNSSPAAETKTVGYQGPTADAVYERSYSANSGDAYEIKVTLKASAGDEYYSELLEQAVTLSLTWGAGTGDMDSKDMANVYFSVPASGDGALASNQELFVHIYKGTKVVTAYPGLKMDYEYLIEEDKVVKKVYSAPFDKNQYDSFKFIKATTTKNDKNEDVVTYTELATATQDFKTITNKPYYSGEFKSLPDPMTYDFYIRGILNGKDCWGWTAKDQDRALSSDGGDTFIVLNLTAGDKFKVWARAADKWYAGQIGPGSIDEEGNYVVSANGSYTVCFQYGYHEGWADVGDNAYFYCGYTPSNP